MSSTSPQAEAAGQQQEWQARLAQQLSSISQPELRSLVGNLSGMVCPGNLTSSGMLRQDAGILSAAQGQLNAGYDQALRGSQEAINYGALRSGEGRSGVAGGAITQAATGIERDRQAALRNLQFMSAQSSLTDYNQVLSLLGQGANASLGLAQGFSGAAGAAAGGLSNQSQLGGTLGGAASGAALGTTILPGWGTVIGGIVGGAAGYLGSG